LDGSIIISYFGGSNNIFADCTIELQWLKPVMRCQNPQKTKNHDAIEIINPPVFNIVLRLG
jgi:hypothetical protein